MTILQMLQKAGLAVADVEAVLAKAGDALPDLKPQIDDIVAKLNASIDPANLVAVAQAIPTELMNIAQGKLDPHDHPGDAA